MSDGRRVRNTAAAASKKLRARIPRRFLHGLSHDRSRAARVGAFIEGRVMRIQRRHAHALGRHRQLLGDHLQKSRAHALADFHGSGRKQHAAIVEDFHRRVGRLVGAAAVFHRRGDADAALFRPGLCCVVLVSRIPTDRFARRSSNRP